MDSKLLNKFIVIFIGIIFLASMFAMYQSSDEEEAESFKVGNYTFYKGQGVYSTEVKGQQIEFVSNPEDLTNISIDEEAITLLLESNKVYFSYNPNSMKDAAMSYQELGRILDYLGKQVVQSYIEDSTPSNPSIPLKRCSDSTEEAVVIELRDGDTEVSVEGSCVVISGGLRASSKTAMWLLDIKV